MKDPSVEIRWYAIRVTYCRELRLQALLTEKGIESFVPMCWRTVIRHGIRRRERQPPVHNLVFVHASRKTLDAGMELMGETRWVSYVWDKGTRAPLTVPDKAMEDFIQVSASMDEDLVYLTKVNPSLREGMRVRVTSGAFRGVEGTVVRIRKSRRVLVELPGMLAVATTYIPSACLEEIQG